MWRRVEVRGTSMQPTYEAGDRLLAFAGRVRRGDVVLVRHPTRPMTLLKRLVAIPGDEWAGGRLGADEYAVRGDNRSATSDSSDFGPVAREALLARVVLRYRRSKA